MTAKDFFRRLPPVDLLPAEAILLEHPQGEEAAENLDLIVILSEAKNLSSI